VTDNGMYLIHLLGIIIIIIIVLVVGVRRRR
jgi:hypothetical protein